MLVLYHFDLISVISIIPNIATSCYILVRSTWAGRNSQNYSFVLSMLNEDLHNFRTETKYSLNFLAVLFPLSYCIFIKTTF